MKKYLFILGMIVLFSCNRQNSINQKSSFIKIDLFSEPTSLISNLSDIASDVEYIPLQTSKNSLISLILNVKTNGEIITVHSNIDLTVNELICFDRTGRYLYKLSKSGRGPGEYLVIGDFDINSKGNALVLNSRSLILVYDIKGNRFVYNKTLNFESTYYNTIRKIDFIPGQNNILISYSSSTFEKFRNLLINLDGDTLDSRLNYYKFSTDPTQGRKIILSSGFVNINYNYSSSIHFKDWFSDTVFTINESNKIIPYFSFDSDGKQFSPEFLAELIILNHTNQSGGHPQDFVTVDFIMESPRYIVYNYKYKKETFYEVYDKELNKKIGISSKPFLEDDITGGLNIEPKLSHDGKMYSWVEAIELKNYVSSEKFRNLSVKDPKKKQDLESLANSLKETDNPVLVIVTLSE